MGTLIDSTMLNPFSSIVAGVGLSTPRLLSVADMHIITGIIPMAQN